MNSARSLHATDFRRTKSVHLADLGRRESARKRGCRARRERECRRILKHEVAYDFATRTPLITEPQHVPVLALMNDSGIVNLDELLIAIMVGDGDEQIEPLSWRSKDASRDLGLPMAVTASYISSAMRGPLSGGLNHRDRTKSESLRRTSRSLMVSQTPWPPTARQRV
jgi:hypothetical protein